MGARLEMPLVAKVLVTRYQLLVGKNSYTLGLHGYWDIQSQNSCPVKLFNSCKSISKRSMAFREALLRNSLDAQKQDLNTTDR